LPRAAPGGAPTDCSRSLRGSIDPNPAVVHDPNPAVAHDPTPAGEEQSDMMMMMMTKLIQIHGLMPKYVFSMFFAAQNYCVFCFLYFVFH
jgi:hypothetical protein